MSFIHDEPNGDLFQFFIQVDWNPVMLLIVSQIIQNFFSPIRIRL